MTSSTSPPPSAHHTCAGKRSYQHDRLLVHHHDEATVYAVADGHGEPETGHLVSDYCVRHLPSLLRNAGVLGPPTANSAESISSAIGELDAAAIRFTSDKQLYAGSTLCALIRHRDTLTCANVGDSRAVLVRCPSQQRPVTVPLSKDHLCTDPVELARIRKAGGVVAGKLLNGYISMSRALGNQELKEHRNVTRFPIPGNSATYSADLFTSLPDVTHRRIGRDDAFVVIASDGVWGKMSNDDVASIVCKTLSAGESIERVSKAIVKRALSKGSNDNITAIVALLKDLPTVRNLVTVTSRSQRRVKLPSPYASTISLSTTSASSTSSELVNSSMDTIDTWDSSNTDPDGSPRKAPTKKKLQYLSRGAKEVPSQTQIRGGPKTSKFRKWAKREKSHI